MKPYTAIIAWDDDDLETGEFRATVLAESAEDAEAQVRAMMWDDDVSKGAEGDEAPQYGRAIEVQAGAMYEADDLAERLRAVLSTLSLDPSDPRRREAFEAGEEILARLDAGNFNGPASSSDASAAVSPAP